MRRLWLLLLILMACGSLVPAAAPAMAPAHHQAMHSSSMPCGHCPDHGTAQDHGCLGCAIEPGDEPAVAKAMVIASIGPEALVTGSIEGRSPGFDPPPPRRYG